MSSERTALSLRGLGKYYTISAQRERPSSFGEMLVAKLRHPLLRAETQTFWALRDLSLEIEYGDTIGVIGRNGAGKSTLLKVLSRVTEPSAGEVALYGRVGSLLEVGTGFHPELTGRENIFLNGALLGMRRAEIVRQFEAIVAFASVGEFLDTPVKRYSSGMYVRLAFAVAAHLEPEILLVDEVLAVGDAEFQQKCLGKMQDVAASGRAVLFVSHSTAAVRNLCRKCLVLDKGRLAFFGETDEAIALYSEMCRDSKEPSEASGDFAPLRPSWARPLISKARLLNRQGKTETHFPQGAPFTIEMTFEADDEPLRRPVMGVVIRHIVNGTVGGVNMRMTDFSLDAGAYRRAVLRCVLDHVPLLQGQYAIDLWLGEGVSDVDMLSGCLDLTIEESDIYGTGRSPFSHMGSIYLEPEWQVVASE